MQQNWNTCYTKVITNAAPTVRQCNSRPFPRSGKFPDLDLSLQ